MVPNAELAEELETFVKRLRQIESELEDLKNAKKDLIEDYKEKLDTKTLNTVLRVLKAESKVEHKDTYDQYKNTLEGSKIFE